MVILVDLEKDSPFLIRQDIASPLPIHQQPAVIMLVRAIWLLGGKLPREQATNETDGEGKTILLFPNSYYFPSASFFPFLPFSSSLSSFLPIIIQAARKSPQKPS